jgi:hypothetical protein
MTGKHGDDGVAKILALFRRNYVPARRMERDRQREKYMVLRSKVELGLRVRGFGSPKRSSESMGGLLARKAVYPPPWGESVRGAGDDIKVSVRLRNIDFRCPQGRQNFCGRRGMSKDDGGCALSPKTTPGFFIDEKGEQLTLLVPAKEALPAWDGDGTVVAHLYRKAFPPGITPIGLQAKSREIVTDSLGRRIYLPLPGRCAAEALDQEISGMVDDERRASINPVPVRLLRLFCLAKGKEEQSAVSFLANEFGIRPPLFAFHGSVDFRQHWRQYEDMLEHWGVNEINSGEDGGRYLCIRNEGGFVAETVQCHPDRNVILPVTVWGHDETGFRTYLNLPSRNPRLSNTKAIQEHRDVPVILTESVEEAIANGAGWSDEAGDPRAIWASWYGEREAVAKIDWGILRRRQIYYLIAPDPHLPGNAAIRDAYLTARAVYEKLSELRGTGVLFVELGKGPGGEVAVWSVEEFMQICRHLDVHGTQGLGVPEFLPRSMKTLAAAPGGELPFLLEPILQERSTTLLYAKTNIGKTWLALCMGAAVSHGVKLLGSWKAPRARKVLYLDFEMDEPAMDARVKTVSRMAFDGRRLPRKRAANFECITRSRAAPGVELFKRQVVEHVKTKGIALVVLDNLTAFTQHNDSAKAWEDVHLWIDQLKDAGCATLMIHHENRQGGQRGTSATTNAVDNVLHLVDPDAPGEKKREKGQKKRGERAPSLPSQWLGKLTMKVKVEKGRSIHGQSRAPFIVSLNPAGSPPTCERHELPPDDVDYPGDAYGTGDGTAMQEKRAYRASDADKQKFRDAFLVEYRKGKSKTKIARQLGVSPARILSFPGLVGSAEYAEAEKERDDREEERDRSIFERARQGDSVVKISRGSGVAQTSVRRVIYAHASEALKRVPGFSVKWDSNRVCSVLGLDNHVASSLLKHMRRLEVPELRKAGRDVAQIGRDLSLSEEEVLRILEVEDRKAPQEDDKQDPKERIVLLDEKKLPDGKIAGMVDLGPRKFAIELNRVRSSEAEGEDGRQSPPPSTED